jgi:hypothetical protein
MKLRKYWRGTNGGCENGRKTHRGTGFKFAKTKGSNIKNKKKKKKKKFFKISAPTQKFILYLPS